MEITFALDKKNSTPGNEVYNLRGPVDLLIEGETVNVLTKSGKLQPRTVGRVFWRGTDNDGNAIALAEQFSAGKKPKPSGGDSSVETRLEAIEKFLAGTTSFTPAAVIGRESKAPSDNEEDQLPF